MNKFLLFLLTIYTFSFTKCSVIHNQRVLNGLKPRIIGGNSVIKETGYPWMVSIVYYGSHHCGGSIINTKIILSAAHCTLLLNLRFLKVRVGSIYRSSGGQLVKVDSFIAHEKFDLATMDYDVAIFHLSEKLNFNSKIRPIALQQSGINVADGISAIVTGWGALTKYGIYPEILQYLKIEVESNERCKKYMHNLVTDRMLCAGDLDGTRDACNLDSGGPLMVRNKLIGIVSWGIGCATANRFGVYANVSYLRTWIEDTLFTEYNEII